MPQNGVFNTKTPKKYLSGKKNSPKNSFLDITELKSIGVNIENVISEKIFFAKNLIPPNTDKLKALVSSFLI